MKCTDCLPLLEEFFDGEVDEKTGGRMQVHLASCADCAEAFDALRAEQELFLRYDRNLEVTPALWQGVRAEIAKETARSRRPFLVGLREQLGAAVALIGMRPAFASSFALVIIGVTVGAIWLGRSWQTMPASNEVRDSVVSATPAPTVQVADVPTPQNPSNTVINASYGPNEDKAPSARSPRSESRQTRVSDDVVALKLHEVSEDVPVMIDPSVLSDVADAAAMLDPEDEAVARHVEKAQILLRSFKNTRPAEGTGEIGYERDVSRRLLDENISLRLEAEASGNKTATRVLNSLEPFLLDISNLQERPSRGEVRSIKDRMEKQEIIAALHVYDD